MRTPVLNHHFLLKRGQLTDNKERCGTFIGGLKNIWGTFPRSELRVTFLVRAVTSSTFWELSSLKLRCYVTRSIEGIHSLRTHGALIDHIFPMSTQEWAYHMPQHRLEERHITFARVTPHGPYQAPTIASHQAYRVRRDRPFHDRIREPKPADSQSSRTTGIAVGFNVAWA